jgi:hypothetical protein
MVHLVGFNVGIYCDAWTYEGQIIIYIIIICQIIIWLIFLAHEPISIWTIEIVLVLRRFDLQPNIRERNPVVKRDPTVYTRDRW